MKHSLKATGVPSIYYTKKAPHNTIYIQSNLTKTNQKLNKTHDEPLFCWANQMVCLLHPNGSTENADDKKIRSINDIQPIYT